MVKNIKNLISQKEPEKFEDQQDFTKNNLWITLIDRPVEFAIIKTAKTPCPWA